MVLQTVFLYIFQCSFHLWTSLQNF